MLRLDVQGTPPAFVVTLEGRRLDVEVRETSAGFVSLLVDGVSHEAGLLARADGATVVLGGRVHEVDAQRRMPARPSPAAPPPPAPPASRLPCPAGSCACWCRRADAVAEGQGLVVMEAMKMENELRAPRAGRVQELHAREQQAVEAGALLVIVE